MINDVITVGQIKRWLQSNCPPFAWQRVIFRILPKLNNMGIYLQTIEKDDFILKPEALSLINDTIYDIFKKRTEFITYTQAVAVEAEPQPATQNPSIQDIKSENNFHVKVTVKQLKEWAATHCSPTAWTIVVVNMIPIMKNLNISWQNLYDDNFLVDEKLLNAINQAFQKYFNKSFKI